MVGVHDIITSFKFGDDQFSGFWLAKYQSLPFPVTYRPGFTAPTGEFFDDFADVLERVSTYACPLILLGDINLHLDITDDPHTVKWQSILDSHVGVRPGDLTNLTSFSTHSHARIQTVFQYSFTQTNANTDSFSEFI